MQRFQQGNTFRTRAIHLVMPSEYKAKRFMAKTWHNPYAEKEQVKEERECMKREHLFSYDKVWNGKESRQGWADLREEVICLKGTTCYVCGTALHPSEVEVDHVTPRTWFKAPQEADRMKHLQPICTSCHRAKTKSDLSNSRRRHQILYDCIIRLVRQPVGCLYPAFETLF
jgi:5-methylcytosine-specific restriction endonuclease McrA